MALKLINASFAESSKVKYLFTLIILELPAPSSKSFTDLVPSDPVLENNQLTPFFIVYSDGTSENVEVYVGDFQEKIEAIFANYLK